MHRQHHHVRGLGPRGAGNLRGVFVASYTDTTVDEDVPPLSASDEVVLTPAG